MPDTGKERRWEILECGYELTVEGPRPLRAPDGVRHVEVMPVSEHEAALAKAHKEERERVREGLVTHVGEWALGLRMKKEVTVDDWAELRRIAALAGQPDTDDLCTCGHVRHEHHTWNENASVGCAFCACEQFHLDLDSLTKQGDSNGG